MTVRQPSLKEAKEKLNDIVKTIEQSREVIYGVDCIYYKYPKNRHQYIKKFPRSDITKKCFFCDRVIVDKRDGMAINEKSVFGPEAFKQCNSRRKEDWHYVDSCISCYNKNRQDRKLSKEYNDNRLLINRIERIIRHAKNNHIEQSS